MDKPFYSRVMRAGSVRVFTVVFAVLLAVMLWIAATTVSPTPARAIVGGQEVSEGKYTFMAALIFVHPETQDEYFYCGGSLIDPDSVLTAAHCILRQANPPEVMVQHTDVTVGATELGVGQGQVRDIRNVWYDPRYITDPTSKDLRYDAAVINLEKPVTAPHITPIDVATKSQNYLERPDLAATVAGWGPTTEGGPPVSVLNEARVPILTDVEALVYYPDAYYSALMIAAGGDGKGTCGGDSGGPLFSWNGKTRNFTQIGIVSGGRGLGTCTVSYPTVYTEVNNPDISSLIAHTASQ